jgi:EAL domain-containing protein (putative c-di-GMP-specific phosphodiesterase class I)
LSGDEFGFLLDDISDISDTLRVADRIQEQLAKPFQCGSEEVFTSGRMGVALSTTGYERAEDALRDATLALHRVKSGTAVRHEVFDPVVHRRAHARMELETDLRWAMEREEFRVFYQPIVSLEDGMITGLEALLRWEHPRRGLLEPSEFLSVAEQTGMIIPLGSWVLEHSCRQMRKWHDEISRDSPLFLSVNLSGKQLLWKDIAQHVGQVLEETGLDGRSLRLEMKEVAMLDDADPMLSVLSELKELNVSLDIDDFGIGYSSLRSLHRFPIDSLKIDRSFIEKLHIRRESEEIVRTILALAQNIGVSVVAEGVESPEELATLKKLNCEMGPGAPLFRPAPARPDNRVDRRPPLPGVVRSKHRGRPELGEGHFVHLVDHAQESPCCTFHSFGRDQFGRIQRRMVDDVVDDMETRCLAGQLGAAIHHRVDRNTEVA